MNRMGIVLTSVMLAAWVCPARLPAAPPSSTAALKAYAEGRYADCVARLAPLHERSEASIQQGLLLARAHLKLDRPAEARRVLESVLEADKSSPEAHRLLGEVLAGAGEYEKASEHLLAAHRARPDAQSAALLGRCFHELGKPAKAKRYLSEAMETDVRNPANAYLLGSICLQRGQGALAEKHLLTAREAGMDTPELSRRLGKAYLLQRKYVGPVLVRRIDRQAKPGDVVEGYLVLGRLQAAPDRYRVCTEFSALFEGGRLAKAKPGDGDALYMLARGWLAAGDMPRAGKRADELRQVEPHSPRYARLRAELLIAAGQMDGLPAHLEAMRKAKALADEDAAEYLYRAAAAQRAEGKADAAVRTLQAAETLTPADTLVLRMLAELHRAAGRKRQAAGYYQRLIDLSPDAEDIAALRNTLSNLQGKKGV